MKNGRYYIKKRREGKNTHHTNLSKLMIFFLLIFKIVFANLMLKDNIRLLDNYFPEIHLVIQGTGVATQKFISNLYSFTPSEVIVNGERATACDNKYQCNLGTTKNNMTLKFDDQINSFKQLFYNVKKIIAIDLSDFDSSQVTSMEDMFYGCSDLEIINFKNINTGSVESMKGLFKGCSLLTSIDISNFDTTKVTSMDSMFGGCSQLKSLDLSNFYTPSLKDTYNMFGSCSSLQYLDLSTFDTSGVTYMYEMFTDCTNLKYIDLSSFSGSSLNSMQSMFYK